MKDAKQIIRELVEEVIEEMTATGAVAGYMTPAAFRGHKSKKKSAERSMPGVKVVGKEVTDDTTIGESENESLPTVRRGASIMEAHEHERCISCDEPTGKAGKGDDSLYINGNGPYCQDCYEKMLDSKADVGTSLHEARSRYRNFKDSDMMKNHAKISYGINQSKKMLGEVEYLLNICERLKTECGYTNDNLWERTRPDMQEIHRRLKEIAKRINRMGKQ